MLFQKCDKNYFSPIFMLFFLRPKENKLCSATSLIRHLHCKCDLKGGDYFSYRALFHYRPLYAIQFLRPRNPTFFMVTNKVRLQRSFTVFSIVFADSRWNSCDQRNILWCKRLLASVWFEYFRSFPLIENFIWLSIWQNHYFPNLYSFGFHEI